MGCVLQFYNSEGAGLSSGCVSEGICRKTTAKALMPVRYGATNAGRMNRKKKTTI